MLESPTGTGKTICLLTAIVAYMKAEKEKTASKLRLMMSAEEEEEATKAGRQPIDLEPMTLIYCTRTHA